ncbi:hypothetical protein ACJX0J_016526, partial [Zea mays]
DFRSLRIFQILFWTEVILWSSVIFQIFGAIFKMGDHEVRAQSNPIQTTESLFCFTCLSSKQITLIESNIDRDNGTLREGFNRIGVYSRRASPQMRNGMKMTTSWVFRSFESTL